MGNSQSRNYTVSTVNLRKWALVTPYKYFTCDNSRLDSFVFGIAEQYEAKSALICRGYEPSDASRTVDRICVAWKSIRAGQDVRSADYIEFLNESKKILMRIGFVQNDVSDRAEFTVLQICLVGK